MGLFGTFAFGQLVYKLIFPRLPKFETMGAVGALALVTNCVCLACLLMRSLSQKNAKQLRWP
jgi:Co/Zn/Cd efflux system component